MSQNFDVNIGDTVYWYERQYPYVIQSGVVVEIERSERIVRKKPKTKVLRIKVDTCGFHGFPLEEFYSTEQDAAIRCLHELRFQAAMRRDDLKKVEHAIDCMESVLHKKEDKE